MIYLPFVFFFTWLIPSIKKRGLDVFTYILILYTIISFCSILLDGMDLYADDCRHFDLGFFAPLLYCLLLFVCISPFTKVKTNIQVNTRVDDSFLNLVVFFYFGIFLIVLLTALGRINEIILNNAFDQVRRDAYSGDNETFYNHLSGWPRYVAGAAGELASSSYLLILIFFYNITFKKKSLIFNAITLISSTPQLIVSINQADRSQFFYWMIMLGLGYTMFSKYYSKEVKRKVIIVLLAFISVIVIYLLAVSIARFSYRDTDTSGGIINYAGQSYINFCNFINYLRPKYHSLCEIFPITHTYIIDSNNYFESCEIIRRETGIIVYGFSTFLGFIFSISGGFVMIIFVALYNLIANRGLKQRTANFSYFVRVWCISLVLVLGVFTHFYAFSNTMMALFIWLYIGYRATHFGRKVSMR